MNLDGPGTSLFQGNDLNNFDNLAQREEEEEAIEEQRRRDLELKNMLENAFDDVSFDNDEGSFCNGSQNHSTSPHSIFYNNSNPESDPNLLKQTSLNRPVTEVDKNYTNNHVESFNTPIKHSVRNSQIKRVDFSNDSDNCSNPYRKKVQNGSLHDIVDASGGGDADVQSSLHYNHCFQRSPLGEVVCNGVSHEKNENNLHIENEHDSTERLKILYDVRVREVHRLTELIDSMKIEHENEVTELKKQTAILLAEKERANISQSQLQSMLIASKQEVEALVNDVKALETINKELETSKNNLLMELDTVKFTVDDLQRKILILEKGGKIETVQYEKNLKALTEKNNLELMSMKKEIDTYIANYEAVIKENEDLKLKISNLSQINDENLAKKSEIISRLSKQIDETQKQCQNLMKSSTVEDNFRLQTELKMLKEEKMLLNSKLEYLEKENGRKEEEIKQLESLSKMSFLSGSLSNSKEFESSGVNGKLSAELYKALNNQKAKGQEIKMLTAQLNEKTEQIALLIENEKSLKNEIANLKEEVNKCLTKISSHDNLILLKEEEVKNFEKHIESLKKDAINNESFFKSKCEELEKENKCLMDKISCLEKESNISVSTYNEEYMRFHNDSLERIREETEKQFKLELLKKDLEIESFKKEVEELKNLYVEVYSVKENLLTQMEKEKESSGRSSVVDMEEVKRLQKELEKSRNRILEMDQTLKQQYQQEVEILNLEINQLNLQIEKIKKERDREIAEKDKISVENELLKSEIEQVTSEKNLLFLNCEKLKKEVEEFSKNVQKIKENSKVELNDLIEKHEQELQNLSNKYEIIVKKLKKEVEQTVTRSVKYESKYTSPIKGGFSGTQDYLTTIDKSTSPICSISTQDCGTSPMSGVKKGSCKLRGSLSLRDISVLTDPEPVKIPKKEVIEIMEKLGAQHNEEMKSMENKYRMELVKLDKKFQVEVDKAKEIIRRELQKEYLSELEQLEEKRRIELENRIEEEKKEAVVDLITEWACEVQGLKVSHAEAQAELERMKMKYKAAKSVALQYKTYFKSKAEYMKEEWKRIEDGYERALKELEKNVHILVDVKEDEVKTKVESITKLYEEKITKMKEKLSKCEDRLKAERRNEIKKKGENSRSEDKFDFCNEIEKLSVPEGYLYHKPCSLKKKKPKHHFGRYENFLDVENGTEGFQVLFNKQETGECSKDAKKNKNTREKSTSEEEISEKDRTNR